MDQSFIANSFTSTKNLPSNLQEKIMLWMEDLGRPWNKSGPKYVLRIKTLPNWAQISKSLIGQKKNPTGPTCNGIFSFMTGWYWEDMLVNNPQIEHLGCHIHQLRPWKTAEPAPATGGTSYLANLVQISSSSSGFILDIPSGYVKIALEPGPVEIVSFPCQNGDSPCSYVDVYQRLSMIIYVPHGILNAQKHHVTRHHHQTSADPIPCGPEHPADLGPALQRRASPGADVGIWNLSGKTGNGNANRKHDHAYIYIYIHTYTYVLYMRMCVYIYLCMCVYMCI